MKIIYVSIINLLIASGIIGVWRLGYQHAYDVVLEHIISCLENGTTPTITIKHGEHKGVYLITDYQSNSK